MHISRRPFVGDAEVRMPDNFIVNDREANGRRERIGQSDDGAVIEKRVDIAGVGGFRKTLVAARDRILRQPLGILFERVGGGAQALLGRGDLHQVIDDAAHRTREPMSLGATTGGGELVARPCFLEVKSVIRHPDGFMGIGEVGTSRSIRRTHFHTIFS